MGDADDFGKVVAFLVHRAGALPHRRQVHVDGGAYQALHVGVDGSPIEAAVRSRRRHGAGAPPGAARDPSAARGGGRAG